MAYKDNLDPPFFLGEEAIAFGKAAEPVRLHTASTEGPGLLT